MHVVGFVPVRSGSKRAPGKNTAVLAGKPAYLHAAETLAKSKSIARVVVSSDDEEVLCAARELGYTATTRSGRLAGDSSSVLDVVRRESLDWGSHDAVAVLYATAALVRPETVDEMISLCVQHHWSYPVLAVRPYEQPFYQALRTISGGLAQAVFPDMAMMRTQDAPPVLVDAGGAYVYPRSFIASGRGFYDGPLLTHPASQDEFLDVDVPEDLEELRIRVEGRQRGWCNP